jgi:hypothetical protein
MSRALLILNSPDRRARAAAWCRNAPAGTRVEFREAKRSTEQNARMWAMLTDVSKQATHMGRRYTPEEWKVLFMQAIGQEVQFVPALDGKTFVPFGYRSSELSKAEMSELIESIFAWGAQNGVVFHDDEVAA